MWINNTNTGNKTAAPTDPIDTILVRTIKTNANTKQINPIFQLVINKTPNDVATPFPPLKLKNTGNVCPITTRIPAICTNNDLSEFFAIAPTIIANIIAATPFNASHKRVKTAAFVPTDLSMFVAPAFPLPFSLTSKPAIFLLIITEKLTLPIKYATIATIIYAAIFIYSFQL